MTLNVVNNHLMMKAFFILFFLSFSFITSLGQQLGISGGYCTNYFYDFNNDESTIRTEYEEGSGSHININLDNVYLDTFLFRFSLNFTKYYGSIKTVDGGRTGTSSTTADVEKYILGLAIFPINIKILNELKINIGGEFNYLLNSNVTGTKSSWSIVSNGKKINLADGTVDILKEFNFGITSRIGYAVKLKNSWSIVPEYNFYLGLTNEFENIESNVKSFRHYFMIGFINRFNN